MSSLENNFQKKRRSSTFLPGQRKREKKGEINLPSRTSGPKKGEKREGGALFPFFYNEKWGEKKLEGELGITSYPAEKKKGKGLLHLGKKRGEKGLVFRC